jgi:UDP-glucose 4-epimerase
MNVLVTGGMGYIGSHTCIALHQAGITPVIFDNLSNASAKVLDQLETITGQRFAFINSDIADAQALEQALRQSGAVAVLHFAASKAVGESTAQPLRYYRNNVASTVNLLEVMQKVGIHQLIFSSSATVYGDPEYLPLDEQHPIRATNPYGWTKVMTEQILQDLCQAETDFLAVSLRYFNPVGAHPSGLLGESPQGIPNNLLPFVAQTAVGRRPFVSIYGTDYPTPDGSGVRDYLHVMDLARGHVAALLQHQADRGFHSYNLGTGQGYSVLEVLRAFEISAGRTIPYQLAARRPGDIACNYADASKAQQRLSWTAGHSLQQMTDDTWRWQSNYPQGLDFTTESADE